MHSDVSARLEITVIEPAKIVFAIAAAEGLAAHEGLSITVAGSKLEPTLLTDAHGTRLHEVHAPAGAMVLDYQATVTEVGPPSPVNSLDLIRYMRPSRYCESDTLSPTAQAEFVGLSGVDLLEAVSSWVGTRLDYIPGSSRPTDGAVSTLLAREGVCRDYAHLVIALLRAAGIPARMAAAYAPGLKPMDFHAVAEAYVDGVWNVVDATVLAPRQNMIRIATGRDAADTAFMDVLSGVATLDGMWVTAVTDQLATDDVRELVQLG
ncbi:MAG: transglutaminase [Actinobacteria bacterium HGW-Actinobacteria-4]|nr:MAG: transglutaminase [Actinobacteria bacterium HGW-Actinobacteria-4]